MHTYSSATVVATAIVEVRAGGLDAGDESWSGLDDGNGKLAGWSLVAIAGLLEANVDGGSSNAPLTISVGGAVDSKDDIL